MIGRMRPFYQAHWDISKDIKHVWLLFCTHYIAWVFSEFSVVRGGGNDETVSTGCGSPSVLHPWMLLLHMQETALWIPPVCCVLDDICKRQFCGFPQWGLLSSRRGGPDTLAPVLQCINQFEQHVLQHFEQSKHDLDSVKKNKERSCLRSCFFIVQNTVNKGKYIAKTISISWLVYQYKYWNVLNVALMGREYWKLWIYIFK